MDSKQSLRDDLRWIWEAFNKLHASRQNHGFGPSKISVQEVRALADLLGVSSVSERALLLSCVQALDEEYMSWVEERKSNDASK